MTINHIPTCSQLEWTNCSDGTNKHNWSGWPGAWCQICGIEDKNEICLADNCQCQCHDEFWKSYEDAMDRAK